MPNVFISYRRTDSMASTGRIADRLQSHFGADSVFHDVDSIGLGRDFGRLIDERLDRTDVFLVIIGDAWLDARAEDGTRRIDDPEDWVHMEIARALARGNDVPVVPVLVGTSSSPPTDAELPPQLEQLNNRHAIVMRSDATFEGQMQRLIQEIERIGGGEPDAQAPAAAPAEKPAEKKSRRGLKIALAIVAVLVAILIIDELMYVGDPVEATVETAGSPAYEPELQQPTAYAEPELQQPTVYAEPEPEPQTAPTEVAAASGAVEMPDLIDASAPDASRSLESIGLSEISWEPDDGVTLDTDVPEDQLYVTSTKPAAGESVAAGAGIILYLDYPVCPTGFRGCSDENLCTSCYETCATCQNLDEPACGAQDCMSCTEGLRLVQVYEDGTGECVP